jgi:NAD(P)-dependent dehydrogenase (short-subunit alcohol dehydrogenase family)
MDRVCVVTGSASGVGAATAKWISQQGWRVIGVDLHDADIVADLSTTEGRAAVTEGVTRLTGGRIDAVVANAGGGPAETCLQLNYFGTVATLVGLRPLLARSSSPRAVAISSIASLTPPPAGLVEACLARDEAAALAYAREAREAGVLELAVPGMPLGLILYSVAKRALNQWCRRVAPTPEWATSGIALNVVALGYYDTPAAAFVFSDPEARESVGRTVPLRGSFPGRPEAAAKLIGWLIGPENTQLTRQILYADGGYEVEARTRAAAARRENGA